MRLRLKRWLLWGLVAFLAVLALAATVLLNTPLSERVAEHYLARALGKAGGSLTIKARHGTLAGGLNLEGVDLRVPPSLSFTARAIHLRLSRAALLAGTLQLRDLSLESPVLDLTVPEGGSKGGSAGLAPSWLRVSAPRVKVSDGRVTVRRQGASSEPLTVSGIGGQGDLSFFMQHLSVRVESLDVEPPRPAPPTLHASGSLELAQGGGRFDLILASPRSRVHGRGGWTAKGTSFNAQLELGPLALREAATAWPEVPDLLVTGTGSVEGNASTFSYTAKVRAEGVGPFSSSGKVSRTGEALDLSGDCSAPGVSLAAFWPAPEGKAAKVAGTGTWSLHVRGGVFQDLEASAALGRSSVWGLPLDSAHVLARVTPAAVTLSGTFASPLTGAGQGSASFDLKHSAWNAEASGQAVPLPSLLKALGLELSLPDAVHIPEGPWAVGRFQAEGKDGTARLEGEGTDPSGTAWTFSYGPFPGSGAELNLAFSALDPGAWGLPPQGKLTGDAGYTMAGPSGGTLDLRMTEAEWGGVVFKPFQSRLHFGAGTVRLEPVTLDTSAGQATLQGKLGPGEVIDARIEARRLTLPALKPLLGPSVPAGTVDGSVQVTGTRDRPEAQGRVKVAGFNLGELAVSEASLSGRWDSDGTSSDLSLSWKGAGYSGQPVGEGEATVRGGPDAIRMTVEGDWGPGRHVDVHASGRLGLTEGHLLLSSGRVDALDRTFLQEGEGRLDWDAGSLSWSGFTLAKKESRLGVSGHVGLGEQAAAVPLSGTVTARHVPLGLLPLPSTAGSVAGFLDADLAWSGSTAAPRIEGSARLTEGSYRLPQSDYIITPITARLRAEGDRLILEAAHAATPKGGEGSASGYVRFKGLWPQEFKLSVAGKAFPFVLGRNVDGEVDVQAALTGTLLKPVLEGSALVRKGRIQLPELERRQPLPDSVTFVHAPPGSPFASAQKKGPSVVGPLRGSLLLKSDGGLWVSSRNLLAELSGALTLRLTPKGPALDGTLNVLQGRFLFQGRKFDLGESHVTFDGGTDLTPYLVVSATYKVQDTDVEVHLTGRANKPQLSLTSSPPMDQADILSLLVLGHTTKGMSPGEAQSYSGAAAGAVALYGASPLLDAAKNALGLDSMVIGVGPNPQVGFSKYLGDKTVLEYQQTFGALPEWWANLRYQINTHLSVQTGSSSRGTTGIDLFWEQRY